MEQTKDLSPIVHKNVMKKLPQDWQSNHRYYIRTYMHAVSYVAIFVVSYRMQEKLHVLSLQHPKSYSLQQWMTNGANFSLNYPSLLNPFSILKYSLCCVVGWSIHAVLMIGHDCLHGAFAPAKSFLGGFISQGVAKYTWDCITGSTTIEDHRFHHKYTNTKEDTSMILVDLNMGTFGEVLHTFGYSLPKWNVKDVVEFFNPFINPFTKNGLKRWIFDKPWLLIAAIHRFMLYGGMYLDLNQSVANFNIVDYKNVFGIKFKLRPMIGILNMVWTVYFVNIFAYAPHVSPIEVNSEQNDNSDDPMVLRLRNTWETYPNNTWYDHFMQWSHCGLTMHATHHIFSFIPRSLMHIASKELKKAYPQEYRQIDPFTEALQVYETRKVFAGAYDIHDTKSMRDKYI